jgi:hypothetical protein
MCLVFNSSSEKGTDKASKEKNKQDLQLLNEVWKIVTKFPDPAVYFLKKSLFLKDIFILF